MCLREQRYCLKVPRLWQLKTEEIVADCQKTENCFGGRKVDKKHENSATSSRMKLATRIITVRESMQNFLTLGFANFGKISHSSLRSLHVNFVHAGF